jgi:hypothetical protein
MSVSKSILIAIGASLLLFSSCTEKTVDPQIEKEPVYSIYDQIAVYGSTAYVSQQYYRINGYNWLFDSVAALIPVNINDSSREVPIKLKYPNAGYLIVRNGNLYVCTMGSLYAKDSGGIEKVNLTTGTSTVLITEKEIDSVSMGITKIEFKNDSIVYCSYGCTDYSAKIALININSRQVVKKLAGISDASGGMALDSRNGKLYVGERISNASGLLIYSTVNDSLIAGPVSTALPPYSLAFDSLANKLFISTSDYQTGKVRMFDCATQTLSATELAFYQDCVIRVTGGKVFAIERSNVSNVTEITQNFTAGNQIHLADNSNPVDIASVGGNRYIVSLNNLSKVTFVNF